MRTPRRWVNSCFCAIVVLLLGTLAAAVGAELQTFSNVRVLDNAGNDGDSFLVDVGAKHMRVRLYYVDCPETSVATKSDVQQVREQTRYFGLSDGGRTVHFGQEAKAFVAQTLAAPFTVHTAFASALGRSATGRVYGFVTTAAGHDLATLLVQNGLARTRGIGRQTPAGIPRDEMFARLHDLETAAMLKRIGIWSQSDPDRIAALRAEQRREERALQEFQKQAKHPRASPVVLDLNTASAQALQSVKGVGPVLAARIIAGRPYATVDDLRKVEGIGAKKLAQMRPYVRVQQAP